ncbi:hypothetical protein NDU88_010584 [Pleurodeles waltl]|uniref:Uncharacterized protein n=1 Tax=Pleurodeles waltl TaxID=8319 RepID=A0AAV7RZP9_PLEWA|nr:hypothetical protein NDU88_010584 [Pleurodeles waltl]
MAALAPLCPATGHPLTVPETPLPDNPQNNLQPLDDKLNKVFATIKSSCLSMESTVGTLMTKHGFLRDDHCKLSDRMVEGEKEMVVLQPQMSVAQQTLSNLQARGKGLEEWAEDA